MGHVKLRSCAVSLRQTMNCWTDSPGPWEIEAKDNLWTMGFDFCVTSASSMLMSLFGSSEKNLGYVFIINVWTASSAQLYNWMLVCAGGMFVIRTNTFQSILNFRNCWDFIPEWSWGSLTAVAFVLLSDIKGCSFASLRMARACWFPWEWTDISRKWFPLPFTG